MNRKTILLIILVVLPVFIAGGCGCKNKESKKREQDISGGMAGKALKEKEMDDDIRDMIEVFAREPKEILRNSEQKIAQAELNGEISQEEALVLDVQAAFMPDDLDERYQGETSEDSWSDLSGRMQWAIDNWGDLSSETKNLIEPYIVSPEDEKYFENDQKTSRGFIRAAQAAGEWEDPLVFSTILYEGAAKVYFRSGQGEQGGLIREALTDSWLKYEKLLRFRPSEQTKVYYTNTGSKLGLAFYRNGACELRISNKMSPEKIKPTTVHELFHCYQYHMAPFYRIKNVESDWIDESTATWAIDFIYPENNIEHKFLPTMFDSWDHERIEADGYIEYANYLWFFFLSQYLGNDEHVYTVLDKAKNGDVTGAIKKGVNDLPSVYSEFALYNWNKEPWEIYQDFPKFPALSPAGGATDDIYVYDPEIYDKKFNMKKGALRYNYHFFDKDLAKVNKVKFDFSSTLKDENVKRQALIKIGDVWTREDWSELNEREFCRRDPAERVKAVILVFSNADLESAKNNITYSIDADKDCEYKERGYLRVTEKIKSDIKNVETTLELKEVIEYDENEDEYVVTDRIASCRSVDTSQIDMQGAYGLQNFSSSISGTGALSERYEINGDNDIRFHINEDGKSGYILTGLGTDNVAWVNSTITVSGGGSYTETGECNGGLWLPRYELEPGDFQGDRIRGRRNINIGSGGSVELEFDYKLPSKN